MMADNIFQRMSRITQEMAAVAKNLQVGEGKSQYKAVGEADILAAVKPLEAKHGVYSYPVSREVIESGTMEKDGKYGKSVQLYLRIKVTYRFLCIDTPDSFIEIESFGDGVDTQDKAPGKAMTYADKYALMKAYKIITGDDPDQYESEPQEKVTSKKPAYPTREEMLIFIANAYDSENMRKLMDYYHVTKLDDLNDAAVIACYNRKQKR